MFTETARFWRRWVDRSSYRGRWREMVNRSAITLKLMTYAPTGALIAAPTRGTARAGRRRAQLGLPLHLDPRRVVLDPRAARARLHRRGARRSALDGWTRLSAGERRPLKIMYRVDGWPTCRGDPRPPRGVPRLAPVRIGNGAADQLQLDIYGEAVDAVYLADEHGADLTPAGRLGRVVDWLCDNWDQPDDGIWESRGGRQDFTYGRVMCWVAFDRGSGWPRARPARRLGAGPARDAVYQQVMEAAGTEAPQRSPSYNSDVLDASLL